MNEGEGGEEKNYDGQEMGDDKDEDYDKDEMMMMMTTILLEKSWIHLQSCTRTRP